MYTNTYISSDGQVTKLEFVVHATDDYYIVDFSVTATEEIRDEQRQLLNKYLVRLDKYLKLHKQLNKVIRRIIGEDFYKVIEYFSNLLKYARRK